MQTVVFTKNHDHYLTPPDVQPSKHEAYLEGQVLTVRDDVAKAAGDRCRPATEEEAATALKAPGVD